MGLYITGICCILAVTSVTQAEQWRWRSDERSGKTSRELKPAESVRIDNKVRFEDSASDRERNSDEAVLSSAADSSDFYGRPSAAYNRASAAESQGTLDDLLYCRCERAPARSLQCTTGPQRGCNSHEYLCCYSPASQTPHGSDVSNEIGADLPKATGPLLVGPQGPTGFVGPYHPMNTDSGESASAQQNFLFPTRPSVAFDSGFNRPVLVGPGGPTGLVGPRGQGILVGPGGPTGIIGPRRQSVLVGPGGPTGLVGPRGQGVLVGPGGPTGIIGPRRQSVLVGPGGPTGLVGPRGQGVLVGPGGPTGIIGPRRQNVLVGPGGPTGVIGPAGTNGGYGANRPGILVGPGGPTGRLGPGRQVLIGPEGPTGQIGPRRSFGK